MSLGPRWAPTHVQVTVLQARGLRPKAKGSGGSDAYAVMALGKEKFATSVSERCLGSPVWREEATFELPPPPRRSLTGDDGGGGKSGPPAVLQLTVSHRALLGLDKFLGRAEISLTELQNEGGRRSTRWYKLHSRPGKKEKERGEIEVDIQFMRSNMTASMFDLSMKDKPRTTFGKLKNKLKGKRDNGLPDTASAIIPSITHSPPDSEEESTEKEKEKKKSKFKTLFSKPGLQKSNISQSMSVLPTLQPVSERVRLRPSDFQSQWDDDDDDDTLTSVSEKTPTNRVEDNFLYPPSGKSHKRTGKKEAENSSEISVKVKEVKRNERELVGKETNPFEVPVDCTRDQGPDKRKSTDVPVAKASLNPFTENNEEKPEKSAASVKPSQAKPIKPRLGVSSEDETKATSTVSVPPTVSPFSLSHHSSNDSNPFTTKLDPEREAEDSSSSASPSLKLSSQRGSNPFSPEWAPKSNDDNPECFTSAPFHLPSPVASSENNPFASNWRQEPQTENSEDLNKSPMYFSHPPATPVYEEPFVSTLENDSESIKSPPIPVACPSASSNLEYNSSAESFADSKLFPIMPSKKPQSEGQMDPVENAPGSLSGNQSGRFYERIGLMLNTQRDDKEVQVVTPLKENSGSIKKSVTFAADELRNNDRVNSGEGPSDEESTESRPHGENENIVDPARRAGTKQCELNIEDCSVSLPYDGKITSVHKSGSPLEGENEISPSIKGEPPVPIPRVLRVSPKETDISSTALSNSYSSVPPPKPTPRSVLKLKKEPFPLTKPELEDMTSSSDSSPLSRETSTTVHSVATTCHPERGELSESINNDHFDTPIGKHLDSLAAEEFHLKPTVLPVIPEVGSDDEQLSDTQKDSEKMAVCEDLSSTRDGSSQLRSSIEERELASDKKTSGERQTVSLLVKKTGPDDDFKSDKLSVCPAAVILKNENQNIRGSEQKDVDSLKESRKSDYSEFSDRSLFSLSTSSQSYSASSFQSDVLSSDKAESPKKSAAEGLDVKVDRSGKKKLLQAWVSPSETHSNQTQQSGGTVPAKLRLHPVKPMNATTNKPSAKTLAITTKILDNQNETNLKKYDPSDPAYAYAQLTHDELIQLVLKQKDVIAKRDNQVRELEDYIDNLLVRVMEETPNILRVQAHMNKRAGKM
ncbi:rab11 family-interacting protein 1 isoform X2 [Eublepharis macularius]|uniref:Rab11 family-interacting protein 2 n=1 Tax=Eublepharis macularius TaxID=481883 RepID=A0AA97LEW3_EUBMA|nr:rab11 family-interacting protein 1 isoform X2 [Eublepharis macularius]